MNIASIDRRAETLNYSRFLTTATECKAMVRDIRSPAEPGDVRDMAERHQKLIEALANYIESDLRSIQRSADVDLARYPRADVTAVTCGAAIREAWTGFVRPGLRDLEDYLQDISEHDR